MQKEAKAIEFASSPGKTHTLEDLPANVKAESLEQAAHLVAGVVERIR